MSLSVWNKLRTDGATGLLVFLGLVSTAFRRGERIPAVVKIRWRLRETEAELDQAYEGLGRDLAVRLGAGHVIEPADEPIARHIQKIDALHAHERRLREVLTQMTDG